ncbi:MAG: TRAP-type C4-dicarboxylate transporter, periplasmic component [Myxococcales bacterium]|nr:TRAP-type C4-dicarboxylate transporter, periplasmic component [Myxococcales bacterium]
MKTRRLAATLLLAALLSSTARAEMTLRMATVAPEGSTWANLLRSWAREVDTLTQGAVRIRWYFSGATGDELETMEGIRTGNLDGIGSGGMICERLAPSMRIQGLAGVFQSREEAAYVMERIRPTLEGETRRSGFELLILTGLGPEVIFSRTPVRSMADLRKIKLWRWASDEVGIAISREMGLEVVPTNLDAAARAYDQRQSDGFIAIPTAALAFQWSTQARYITDLRSGYLTGCVAVAHRALDRLTAEQQKQFRRSFAKYDALFQEVGRRQDDALLGGLFQKQGLKPIPPSEGFRSEFFETARSARERAATRFVSRATLDRVLKLLADYRAEHTELITR